MKSVAAELPPTLVGADATPEDAIRQLQINALAAHQRSMGTGDQLLLVLERTIRQMEGAHNRVKTMSTVLFVVGLGVLAVGVYGVLSGSQEVWAALLGTSGGVAALAAVFWTTPLDKISASITDLVKLETVFLGYIRVIGEIDSFFQMQYLQIIHGGSDSDSVAKETLSNAISDTTGKMKEMMTHAITLIDGHVGEDSEAAELRRQVDDLTKRLNTLEKQQ